jgi:hypothetical protein
MATVEAPAPAEPVAPTGSVTELVSGIIHDAQTLFKQQAEMLKAEVREDFKKSKRAAEYGAVGIVCTTVGVLGLITAAAYFLHEHYAFKMWASWGIVGGILAVIGVACAGFSYLLLERFNPLPDKTFNALKENLTWQTK